MATGNNNKNQTTEEVQTSDNGGRIYNSQNPKVDEAGATADISAVDQQEGTMNHGETGAGGFTETVKGEESGKSNA